MSLDDITKAISELDTIVYPLKKEDWGKSEWQFLHTVASNYPNQPNSRDKEEAKTTLYHIIKNTQCLDPCRKSAVSYIKENPPNFDSKQKYFDWTVNFHNHVNEKLGKPIKKVTLRNDPQIEQELTVKRRALAMNTMYPPVNQQPMNEIDTRFAQNFPQYNDLTRDDVPIDQVLTNIERSDTLQQQRPEIDRDNVLSSLEGMYEPISEPLGLRPQDINLILTPQILTGILQNVAASNLTPFGMITTSILASLTMFGAGIVTKNGSSYGDRLLMMTIAGGYLSDFITRLDSKSRDKIQEKGAKTVETISNMFSGKEQDTLKELMDCFIETPDMAKNGITEVKEGDELVGLEAVLDSYESVADTRGAQNESQSLADAFDGPGTTVGSRGFEPITVTKTINRETNTLPPFVDNVKRIAVDQSQLDNFPIPTFILPKNRNI